MRERQKRRGRDAERKIESERWTEIKQRERWMEVKES